MEYLTHLEENQEEVRKNKSRFVTDFRNRLCRIPLEHRMAGERKASFILNDQIPS